MAASGNALTPQQYKILCNLPGIEDTEIGATYQNTKLNRLITDHTQGKTLEIDLRAAQQARKNLIVHISKQIKALRIESFANKYDYDNALAILIKQRHDLETAVQQHLTYLPKASTGYQGFSLFTAVRLVVMSVYYYVFVTIFKFPLNETIRTILGTGSLSFVPEFLIESSIVAKSKKNNFWTSDHPLRMLNAFVWAIANGVSFFLRGTLTAGIITVLGFIHDLWSARTGRNKNTIKYETLALDISTRIATLTKQEKSPDEEAELAWLQTRQAPVTIALETAKAKGQKNVYIASAFCIGAALFFYSHDVLDYLINKWFLPSILSTAVANTSVGLTILSTLSTVLPLIGGFIFTGVAAYYLWTAFVSEHAPCCKKENPSPTLPDKSLVPNYDGRPHAHLLRATPPPSPKTSAAKSPKPHNIAIHHSANASGLRAAGGLDHQPPLATAHQSNGTAPPPLQRRGSNSTAINN